MGGYDQAPSKITTELIHEALGFVVTVDKVSMNSAVGLFLVLGNTAKGHKGYCIEKHARAYHPQLAVLIKRLRFQKKCLYASAALVQTIATAEKAKGNFDWSRFILVNLRRQLTTIHSWVLQRCGVPK